MTQAEYIEAAFKQYFPDSKITYAEREDLELLTVIECGQGDYVEVWNFYVGSDDGRYIFVREPREDEDLADHGQPTDVITIPLMPEAA